MGVAPRCRLLPCERRDAQRPKVGEHHAPWREERREEEDKENAEEVFFFFLVGGGNNWKELQGELF